MKVIIQEEIKCDYDNLKKYLPARYIPLVNKNFYNQTVSVICFSDKEVVTSGNLKKVVKKIKNMDITPFFFARCFTAEAGTIVNEMNGVLFPLIDFPWTDESYNRIIGGF